MNDTRFPRMVQSVTSLVVLVLLFSVPSNAQEVKRFSSKGIIELGGSFSFTSVKVVTPGHTYDPINTFSAMPFVGYFVLDGFEIGVNPLGVNIASASGSTVTSLRIFLAPSYNIKTNTIAYPFIEGLAGITSATSSGSTNSLSGFSWGGRVGAKLAIVDHGLLVIGFQYLQVTLNPSGATDRNGTDEFSVSAGWTFWL